MKQNNANHSLVIVLTEHPVLGVLLVPFIVEKCANSDNLNLVEQAFHLPHATISKLSIPEQKAIEIAGHYTERCLMGVYSKEKVTAKFLKSLTDQPEEWKKIRHFIDKKLLQMVELARAESLPIYQKPNGSKVLYPHHLFKLHPQSVSVNLHFTYQDNTLIYRLACAYQKEPLRLTEEKPAIALTYNPCTLALGMNLYFFDHLPAPLLLPFTKKQQISLRTDAIDKYIDKVLLPVARYHKAEVRGVAFEELRYHCQSILYFEETVYDTQLLRLNFRYDVHQYPIEETSNYQKQLFCKEVDGNKDVYYFYRNKNEEKHAIELLQTAGLERAYESHFRLSDKATEKSLTQWIANHKNLLEEHFKLNSNVNQASYCPDEIEIEQSYEKTPDWFEVYITVVIGDFRIPFQHFRKHILEGKREYTLPDGRFILLPETWFSQYSGLMTTADIENQHIRLKHSYIGVIETILEDDTLQKCPVVLEASHFDVPKGLKATLRPYQLKGYEWLMNLYQHGYGGCLADDMGLGKTLQTLAFLQKVHQEKPKPKHPAASLIVVPTSLIHNWKNEIRKFTHLSLLEVLSNHRLTPQNVKAKLNQYHLVLLSYGMLRNNIHLFEHYPFECVVLDESQNIKNSDSLTFRSVVRLQSAHRLVLTGTPIENSLSDLWAQFHFFQPDLLGSEPSFGKQFLTPARNGDERPLLLLRQLISPFILRRTKEEVTPELPPLTERIVYCDMQESQKRIYDKEKNSLRHALLQITDLSGKDRFTVLNGITRLRQLACHPQMIMPDFTETSGKMEQVIGTFETLRSEGHKVLIFSSFVKHLELIATEFQRRGWQYAWLTGATSHRANEIDLFTKTEEIQAFFISLKAGGVGLNLVEADYVFIIDPWWNPAAEAQAIARAHRIGQQKKVIAYRFITENSIEEKIIRLQQQKRQIAATMIADSDALSNLSDREWMELLK